MNEKQLTGIHTTVDFSRMNGWTCRLDKTGHFSMVKELLTIIHTNQPR